jgi:hypothetical protein
MSKIAAHQGRRGPVAGLNWRIFWFAALALLASGCSSERPAVEPEAKAEGSGVILTGHLSSDTVTDGDVLRFWLTVENRTSVPLQSVRVIQLNTPGFHRLPSCDGSSTQTAGCSKSANGQALDPDCGLAPSSDVPAPAPGDWLLCQSLKPGESLVTWGDLTASNPYGPAERLYAVVAWSQRQMTPSETSVNGGSKPAPPPPKASSAKTATSVSANQIGSEANSKAGAFEQSTRIVALGTAEPVSVLHFLTLFTKPEVSIPGALTVLGLLFTLFASRRDERSKVFNAMLGSAHEAAVQYFMPMASTLAAALRLIREATAAQQGLSSADAATRDAAEEKVREKRRQGFYYLTIFHWWQRRVFNKVGAYQLNSRTGERLLLILASKHRDLYPRTAEAAWRRSDVILSDINKETTLDEFLGTLDGGDTNWSEAWSDYSHWIDTDSCKKDALYLEAFVHIMVYEVNGLHQLWYGSRSPMKLSEAVRAAVTEMSVGEFKFEVEEYLRKAENTDTTIRLWN